MAQLVSDPEVTSRPDLVTTATRRRSRWPWCAQ